jgi:hypothetical protein
VRLPVESKVGVGIPTESKGRRGHTCPAHKLNFHAELAALLEVGNDAIKTAI